MELAFCLPVIVVLMLGAIEMSNALFLKQALQTASYEAARVASTDGHTQAEAHARAVQVLNARNIKDYSVTFSLPVTGVTPRGTVIEVTVAAPSAKNNIGVKMFFSNEVIRTSTTMVRN